MTCTQQTEQRQQQARELCREAAAKRQAGLWGEAMNLYDKAAELDPASPAAAARQMLQDIMDFRCRDYYNP